MPPFERKEETIFYKSYSLNLFSNSHFSFQVDGKLNPGTPSGEGVLANFFNSLLHKKSGSPAAASLAGTGVSPRATNGGDMVTASEKISMRTDAAMELDRLARSVKKDLDFPAQTDC